MSVSLTLRVRCLNASILLTLYSRWNLSFFRKTFRALASDLGLHLLDVVTVMNRSKHEGCSFFTKTLPVLGKAFDRGLADRSFKLPSCFKRSRKGVQIPAFCGALFARVFDSYGNLHLNPDIQAIKSLRQLFFFYYKCDMIYRASEEKKILDSFVQTEHDLDRKMDCDPILLMSSSLIRTLFEGIDLASLRPKNGPGVVSDMNHSDKTELPFSPSPLYSRYSDLFWFNPSHFSSDLDRHPTFDNFSLFGDFSKAKVILVPKDSRGPRLISCEPRDHQYIQQGLMSKIVEVIENHAITSGQVNFSDQTINQELARRASLDQSFSTLDLKDASDRNTLSLFNHLFRSLPELRDLILHCRTSKTDLPNGTSVKMRKFAPMGSALCFPIMAITLYTLMLVALVGIGVDFASASSSIFVYGDDIVVPTQYASYLIKVLERYLFKVNTDKSFVNSRFCESCGKDYFDGVDVSTVKLRRNFFQDPKTIVSHVATARNLLKQGYPILSEVLFTHTEKVLGPLPYGSDRSPFLCRVANENFELYNFEIYETKSSTFSAWVTKPIRKRFRESDYGHFLRCMTNIGQENSLVYGVYDAPRSFTISRKAFSKNFSY